MTTESILSRVAAGDRRAVQTCVETYGGLVWSIALRLLGSRVEAEDAAQEVFIELWKVCDRFDPNVASERTFVAMIARRRIIDRVRAAKRRPVAEPIEADSGLTDERHHDIERSADVALAAEVMRSLPDNQRRALELVLGRGLTHREVADEMSIPLGTAKSHVRNALAAVRKRLEAPSTQRSAS